MACETLQISKKKCHIKIFILKIIYVVKKNIYMVKISIYIVYNYLCSIFLLETHTLYIYMLKIIFMWNKTRICIR